MLVGHIMSTTIIDRGTYSHSVTLVKDEKHFDRFDRVFSAYFKGLEELFEEILGEVPLEWLAKHAELMLTEEEKRQIESLGGWDKLMETLRAGYLVVKALVIVGCAIFIQIMVASDLITSGCVNDIVHDFQSQSLKPAAGKARPLEVLQVFLLLFL